MPMGLQHQSRTSCPEDTHRQLLQRIFTKAVSGDIKNDSS
jgi:hypothetical protein